MNIKITKVKPVKVGNSYYFLIPKQYLNNGIVQADKKYNLMLSNSDVS